MVVVEDIVEAPVLIIFKSPRLTFDALMLRVPPAMLTAPAPKALTWLSFRVPSVSVVPSA